MVDQIWKRGVFMKTVRILDYIDNFLVLFLIWSSWIFLKCDIVTPWARMLQQFIQLLTIKARQLKSVHWEGAFLWHVVAFKQNQLKLTCTVCAGGGLKILDPIAILLTIFFCVKAKWPSGSIFYKPSASVMCEVRLLPFELNTQTLTWPLIEAVSHQLCCIMD